MSAAVHNGGDIKTYRIHRPKIVVIGGGTGLPVVIKNLANESVDLTAIVTVADDGGSSGKIRTSLNMMPPGDLRNVMVAMSDMPKFYEELFQYRFQKDPTFLGGHSLGNILIAAISEMKDSTYDAIQILSQMLQCKGKVLPVSEQALTLIGTFDDGSEVAGESQIAHHKGILKSVKVVPTYDHDEVKAARGVVRAIEEADLIIMGPGSLYTSILPNLVIPEVKAAMHKTKAKKMYICNIMTQKGETEEFTDCHHAKVINEHMGAHTIDVALVNTKEIPTDYEVTKKRDEYLVQVTHDPQSFNEQQIELIADDFTKLKDGGIYHNGAKLVDTILDYLGVD
ncbi:MAG: uridine diphosphate-N-acetylglucosamine-binding protein YvcK [Lactobacillales bacterium]|jgi:uncharacterized cofD-like protein|nr:uridine diphosphate-N-acetylglucosamine-binding protein YvcK [Lactobacillales bacterium]